jgi:hypothetical protein
MPLVVAQNALALHARLETAKEAVERLSRP